MGSTTKDNDRVICLIDMDCFYVQVEQCLNPQYLGRPCVVVYSNHWQRGLIVNYEARSCGIKTRGTTESEAMSLCPQLHTFFINGLDKYREASVKVMKVLCQFSDCVERASIDEAYLDLSKDVDDFLRNESSEEVTSESLANTRVIGWNAAQHQEHWTDTSSNEQDVDLCDWLQNSCPLNESDRRLAVGALLVQRLRALIFEKTGFKCSAGIAHNKMLAKQCCSFNKPNGQTIVPFHSVATLYQNLPINKMRSLGGKLGREVKEKLSIETMSELSKLKESHLVQVFGKRVGGKLYLIGQGIDNDCVKPRQLPKSIGCGKNFSGKACLNTKSDVDYWVNLLCKELLERLNKDRSENCRTATLLNVSVQIFGDTKAGVTSRSFPLQRYDSQRMIADTMIQLNKFNTTQKESDSWQPALLNVTLSAFKFQDSLDHAVSPISSYFTKSAQQINDAEDNVDKSLRNDSCSTKGQRESTASSVVIKDNSSAIGTGETSSDHVDELQMSINDIDDCNDDITKVAEDQDNRESHKTNCSEDKFNSLSTTIKNDLGILYEDKMKDQKGDKIATTSASETELCNPGTSRDESSHESIPKMNASLSDLENTLNNPRKTSDHKDTERNEDSSLKPNIKPRITNYLLKQNVGEINVVHDEPSSTVDDDCFKCDKCNRNVPFIEIEEHSDYHFALSLQAQTGVPKIKTLSESKLSSKRKKNGNKSQSSKKPKTDTRTIDYYLK